jgi:hypothetical protein
MAKALMRHSRNRDALDVPFVFYRSDDAIAWIELRSSMTASHDDDGAVTVVADHDETQSQEPIWFAFFKRPGASRHTFAMVNWRSPLGSRTWREHPQARPFGPPGNAKTYHDRVPDSTEVGERAGEDFGRSTTQREDDSCVLVERAVDISAGS